MLKEMVMPMEFWAEAITTTVHILNRSPTTAIEDQTPFEALTGSKAKVDYFKVFGCLTHSSVDSQQRHKLDPKSAPGVFIGYCGM